jgi:hypothetical protein
LQKASRLKYNDSVEQNPPPVPPNAKTQLVEAKLEVVRACWLLEPVGIVRRFCWLDRVDRVQRHEIY